MPDQHIVIVGVRGILVVVFADFHVFHFFLVGEVVETFFVPAGMTAVTVDIGLGMADLTLHLARMDGMIAHGTIFKISVAVFAAHHLFQMIAAGNAGAVGMHFRARMT